MPERLLDIIDNSEGKKLGAVRNQRLEQGEPSVRIVTAYFNQGGFAVLKTGLENAKEFKILLRKEQEREFVIGDRLWDEMEIAMNKKETPPLLKEFVDFINLKKVAQKNSLLFYIGLLRRILTPLKFNLLLFPKSRKKTFNLLGGLQGCKII